MTIQLIKNGTVEAVFNDPKLEKLNSASGEIQYIDISDTDYQCIESNQLNTIRHSAMKESLTLMQQLESGQMTVEEFEEKYPNNPSNPRASILEMFLHKKEQWKKMEAFNQDVSGRNTGDNENEVSWANKAGFCKTPEQVEAIEEQAFENGRVETLADAKAGRYAKSEEIYNKEQTKELIAEAIKEHERQTLYALKKINGVYRLPGAVEELIRDIENNIAGGYNG
ncbi:MAG: hypothetical protein ABJL71_18965 [Cyclobacteriaceae bacterium]